jgi:hypothetical protein
LLEELYQINAERARSTHTEADFFAPRLAGLLNIESIVGCVGLTTGFDADAFPEGLPRVGRLGVDGLSGVAGEFDWNKYDFSMI